MNGENIPSELIWALVAKLSGESEAYVTAHWERYEMGMRQLEHINNLDEDTQIALIAEDHDMCKFILNPKPRVAKIIHFYESL